MKKADKFDPKKLFGVTSLDVVRAETFVQEITGDRDPTATIIPVVGGHSGETIVPLFSQAKPSVNIPEDKLDALVNRMWKTMHFAEPTNSDHRRPIWW
jgi:malate dehydrogenase